MKGIITGGTRGLGFNIAEDMAKEGYTHLILTYNSNDEAAQNAKTALESKYPVKVSVLKGDIGQETTIDEIFEHAKEAFDGVLNAFVHNAGAAVGITSGAETEDARKAAQSYKDNIGSGEFKNFSTYDYFQNIYPKCFIRCVEQAVKMMEDGKGFIIAVSTYGSNVLQTPKPGYAITAQAKGCMELLVRYYAQALAPRGITVNAVIPGYVMSDAWHNMTKSIGGIESEAVKKRIQGTPMRRFGEGREFSQVVSFLCSPRASFITGVALPVDGGLHLQ
ncbi:uncharacterized protein LOC110253041 [Exaiptasia diaphana]|uniref:Uncharacterized protein n=1 Tax=Exaiptasia diaphana TaxID=2652724 RepID=A0A913Y7V7_EXADI|nr:uncharacterized protein LOC110253041 [Exaiptasia diaphana]KXJ22033.1 Enoyl-[acyl-carrier-protein] reductase [NADPH] FabL [Exaiptasia diaphana]